MEWKRYMYRAYGTPFIADRFFPWIEIHGYNVKRAYGSATWLWLRQPRNYLDTTHLLS